MSFKNKIVWITGASSGIGEALTEQLIREGAKVIISSRRKEVLEEIRDRFPARRDDIHVLPLDLADIPGMEAKGLEALSFYGHIDYLINNGGISQRALVADMKMDVLEQIMNVNFMGTAAVTKSVLPSMIDRKSGHIVVISSVMGKFGTQLRSGYSASKHALQGFFDSLRNEVYKDNIKVTIICPGYVRTNVSINAVTADGSKHGVMEPGQEHGISPEVCAEKILSAVSKGKNEVLIGGKEILGVYLKRFVPNLFMKILRNMEVH